MIDWRRLAEPQSDGYDSAVVLRFASAEASPRRCEQYIRRNTEGFRSIFDGRVAVRRIVETLEPPVAPDCTHGRLDDPRIDLAVDYVRSWPTAFRQFQELIDTFHPIAFVGTVPDGPLSSSHSIERFFGAMLATCHDPVLLAECFVHELAHNKLRALGLGISTASGLIANRPDELFVSPLIKGRRRPMSAVLHATYAVAHIVALDLHVAIHCSHHIDSARRFALNLQRNIERLKQGTDEVRANLKATPAGSAFVEGLVGWANRLLAASWAVTNS